MRTGMESEPVRRIKAVIEERAKVVEDAGTMVETGVDG